MHNSLGRGDKRRGRVFRTLGVSSLQDPETEYVTQFVTHASVLLAQVGTTSTTVTLNMMFTHPSSQRNKAIGPFHVPYCHTTLLGVGTSFISSSSFTL